MAFQCLTQTFYWYCLLRGRAISDEFLADQVGKCTIPLKRKNPLSPLSSIYIDSLCCDVSSQPPLQNLLVAPLQTCWEPMWVCFQHVAALCSLQHRGETAISLGANTEAFSYSNWEKFCIPPPSHHSSDTQNIITEINFCSLSWHRYFEIILTFNASTLPRQPKFQGPRCISRENSLLWYSVTQ